MTAEELRKAKWLVADVLDSMKTANLCFPSGNGSGWAVEMLVAARQHMLALKRGLEKEVPDADT